MIRRCAPRSIDDWTGVTDPIRDPKQTQFVWYAEVGADETTIWANFQGADPNAELVEINVRPAVFFPTEHHLDYITVRGFELCQAACPWTPPTADQPGLIGPNWAKGWIIEDNDIHDAKCSAISIGKEASTGHNYATHARRQARLPVPARVGLLRPEYRLGHGAHRLARHPPQHDPRLRPERHRRAPGLRVLHDRGQPHLQHRHQA